MPQRPIIQLSRVCAYLMGGNLTNQATVTQYNAENKMAASRNVYCIPFSQ